MVGALPRVRVRVKRWRTGYEYDGHSDYWKILVRTKFLRIWPKPFVIRVVVGCSNAAVTIANMPTAE